MILPEGMKKFNNERKFREKSDKLKNPETSMKEHHEIMKTQSTTTTTTSSTITPKAPISKRVSDVEYDDDFEQEFYEDRFDEIPSMAFINDEPKFKYEHPEIREFAIDVWNGSPGLKYWGYNESKHYNE